MKKKKISLIAALAVTFATSICASVGIWAHSVHAQETSEPILIGGEINNEYILDEYLSVSDAQISCGGKTADAKVIVKKPDGELVQSTNVRLDMGGIYTIEYRAVIDGKLKTIKKISPFKRRCSRVAPTIRTQRTAWTIRSTTRGSKA